MRDQFNFKEPFRRTLIGPTGANVATGNVQGLRSERSDVTPTDPGPGGFYHEITGYRAFYMVPSYAQDSVSWGSPYGQYTYAWSHGELPSGAWRLGCKSDLTPDIPLWVLNQVRTILDARIRENLDISVFAGEARETARTLVETLSILLKSLRGLRSAIRNFGSSSSVGSIGRLSSLSIRDARRHARRGDKLASAYLYYMYGIRPLVADVVRICSLWDKRLEQPVSKRVDVQFDDPSFGPQSYNSGSNLKWLEGTARRGVRTGCNVVVLNPQLFRSSQYGLTSPLSVAWELATLSFVVDWFTGIGNFVRTLETPLGVITQDYYETKYVDNRLVYRYDVYNVVYKNVYTKLIGPLRTMDVHFRTKAMLRVGSPRPLPAPPYVSLGGMGSGQALSLVALITAAISR